MTMAYRPAPLGGDTGGTADGTLTPLPDPPTGTGDAEADLSALRGYVTDQLLPAVRNNLADMQAKVNALIGATG